MRASSSDTTAARTASRGRRRILSVTDEQRGQRAILAVIPIALFS
jgi:hypothetical protein